MAVRTTVEVEDGRPVVRRVGLGHDADPLRSRAEALLAAAGPGVVAVVRSGPVEGGWELVTEHGGQPVDPHRLRTAAATRELGVAVAEVLGRLHERGQLHGGLAAEHVLLDPTGRPVLDGIASGAEGSPAEDVAALADLLRRLVADLPTTADGRERSARAHLRQVLADADRPADRGPTAGQLRAALVAGAPPARLAGPRWRRPGGAVVGLVAAGAVLVVASGGWPGPHPTTGRAPATGPATTATTSTPAAPPTPLPPCVVAQGASPPGCPHSVVIDGADVTVDGRQVRVGREGDELLVGDWGCGGSPRPAVLRPATGEVLVYGALEVGEPVVVLAERIEGATALAAGLDEEGCAALMVVTSDGRLRLT